ncbi:hypothetical protein ncot_03995 [Nocardioides sp. JQ2195]|uniref:hypothetical protein n=1 Tax=Nocardioides sp. JQ2195 TaxID=2592334 RepID=UPI00143EBE59|nr:hypothetical protein [Nocardioides sp. JQ2195]QIX25850.1 hypothetical protein ncot_03995 [Nocardioides sp. JQ2195]
MSDPIKDLENFDPRGLSVNPLTPAEVRRRGDRVRRRNNGVMALGAAAAIAVVATSGVFVSNAVDRGEEPSPATPSRTEQTEQPVLSAIPDDFPIDVGMGSAEVTETGRMDELDFCGTLPLADRSPVDVRSAEVAGGETLVTRTVYLLGDQQTARATQVGILDAARDCAAEGSADGTVEIQRADDAWPGNTITTDLGPGAETEPTVQVVNVMTNGAAVLVTQVWGGWSGDVQAGVDASRAELAELVPELEVFGESPGPLEPSSADPDQDTGSSGDVPTTIPAGFPLADGWPDDSAAEPGRDNGLKGPSRTLGSLDFMACEQAWSEPEHTDRLRADWNDVEDYRSRQLTTYADADAAVAAVEGLVAQQQACTEDPVRDDGYVTTREVREVPVGGEAWAFLERDTLNGSESPFGESTVVVRVGSAVLVIRDGGHAGYPSGDGQAQIDEMTSQAATVVDELCSFTVAGCGGSGTTSSTVLGPAGWGELRIGMTAEELDATGLVTIAEDDRSMPCRAVTIDGWADTVHPNVSGQVHGFLSTAHGLAVIFAQPGMRTPEGIGVVGSTVAEVRAAYGDLSGSDAYSTAPVDGVSYFFLTDGSKVTAFQIEQEDQNCL